MKRSLRRNRAVSNGRITPSLFLASAAAAMTLIFTSSHAAAQVTVAPSRERVPRIPAASLVQLTPEQRKLRQEWSSSMARIPLPKKGCFESSYPGKTWREVPCTTAPPYPMIPRNVPIPDVGGGQGSIVLQVPTGALMEWALGTFDSVTGVTSESGQINATGPSVANAYTIQLNSNPLTSTALCAGSPNPMCKGWEQWVFANDGKQGIAFIQYWLLNFNTACPAHWTTFTFPPPASTAIFCFQNSAGASNVPFEAITNLMNLGLGGSASAAGDTYFFVEYAPNTQMYAGSGDNLVNAAGSWNAAEFIVAGDGGGGQANFNTGATLVSRVEVVDGSAAAPSCVPTGFTGETNNLKFGPTAPAFVEAPALPAILFTESSAGGAPSSCGAASTAGSAPVTPSNHDKCVQACGQGEQQCMSRTHTSHDRQECVGDHNVCVRHC